MQRSDAQRSPNGGKLRFVRCFCQISVVVSVHFLFAFVLLIALTLSNCVTQMMANVRVVCVARISKTIENGYAHMSAWGRSVADIFQFGGLVQNPLTTYWLLHRFIHSFMNEFRRTVFSLLLSNSDAAACVGAAFFLFINAFGCAIEYEQTGFRLSSSILGLVTLSFCFLRMYSTMYCIRFFSMEHWNSMCATHKYYVMQRVYLVNTVY